MAFLTQNLVPGIEFTNDPLLQGRNFSYQDTQLKRLGSPNFTYLPVNAPRSPVQTFQQDGHMTTHPRPGRVNYEPNSWPADAGGPREDPEHGFTTLPEEVAGTKRRARPELFADHYSQARQFYVSQSPTEQHHIAEAFVFELSKCDEEPIRLRMVAGLRNVDEDLARQVADGLGLAKLPDALPPAREPITDLDPSPALSVLSNGPASFAGRKLGVLVTEGTPAGLLAALQSAAAEQQVTVELVAPVVGGVTLDDGSTVPADQKLQGAPSVLYDAVILLPGPDTAATLAGVPAARDFVSDAFAHCKFVGYAAPATKLFDAYGLSEHVDDGFVPLDDGASVDDFLRRCGELRYWARESTFG